MAFVLDDYDEICCTSMARNTNVSCMTSKIIKGYVDDDFEKYRPENWSGGTAEEQQQLYEHMLMYIVQRDLQPKWGESVIDDKTWHTQGVEIMLDYAHFYAGDLYSDIMIFYGINDIKGDEIYNRLGYCHNENIVQKLY
ncbi:Hypothetical predicted protein, partial [Paramuricea clavata]